MARSKRWHPRGYSPLQNAETGTEKATHYLLWCYKNRPGERIQFRELARVVNAQYAVSETDLRKVKGMISHISRRIWKDHKLACDSSDMGMKIVSNVHEYVKTDYIKRYKKYAAGKRAIDHGNEIVEEKKHEFENNPEGRRLKRFVNKVRAASNTAALPSREEVRGLIGTTSEDD